MAELSGFEVLVLAKEISSALRDAYVNNIYSKGTSQLIRFRKPGAEDTWLVISPRRGVWISTKVTEREETTKFTSVLRAELGRTRFSSATQLDLDRVFQFGFEGAQKRSLVVELMPPGNVIVVDSQGVVQALQEEVRAEARRVVKGIEYELPKQNRMSPLDVESKDVEAMISQESTVGRAIGRHVALPRKYVAEALHRLGVEDESRASTLVGREDEVVRVLRGMVAQARDDPRPCICETSRGDEIFVVPPSGLKARESAATVSELCDRLFSLEEQATGAQLDPQEVKRRELRATISKLNSESQSLLMEASKARDSAAIAQASSLTNAVKLLVEAGVKMAKGPTSPAAVASALYDRAKILEVKSAQNLAAAARLEKRASRMTPIRAARAKLYLGKRREWYEKFRWFISSAGKLAIGGRDSQTNSTLLRRHLDSNDTVFHADLFGSPFFVLKGGRGQSEDEAREVAQATVAFSSAWKTGLGSADAYWVTFDQVSSAAPSGEYLPRGSFAIRGKKNFVNKIIVEVAAGLDAKGRVMAGPEEAARRWCANYVVLRPQKEKGSDTAKRVLKDLVEVSGTSHPPSLDEVQRALPTGGGKVVRRAKGDANPVR